MITITANDAYGNTNFNSTTDVFRATITDVSAGTTQVSSTSLGDGLYSISYTIPTVGLFSVEIEHNDDTVGYLSIENSPFVDIPSTNPGDTSCADIDGAGTLFAYAG